MGYGNRIRAKYTAKWDVQIAGMIFQTRSSPAGLVEVNCNKYVFVRQSFIVVFTHIISVFRHYIRVFFVLSQHFKFVFMYLSL